MEPSLFLRLVSVVQKFADKNTSYAGFPGVFRFAAGKGKVTFVWKKLFAKRK
jgi:hypothetical protein